jgi:hypothetical protein
MLHQSAVPLNLWQTLLDMQMPLADTGFALAGGTSLALRLGHRLSVDLDFFTLSPFEAQDLAEQLNINHNSITGIAKGTLQIHHNDLKIEFLKHSYPQLDNIEVIDGIKIWSFADVAAMKINAISLTKESWPHQSDNYPYKSPKRSGRQPFPIRHHPCTKISR